MKMKKHLSNNAKQKKYLYMYQSQEFVNRDEMRVLSGMVGIQDEKKRTKNRTLGNTTRAGMRG